MNGVVSLRVPAGSATAAAAGPRLPAEAVASPTRDMRGQEAAPDMAAAAGRGPQAAAGRLGDRAARALGEQFARALEQCAGTDDASAVPPAEAAAVPWPGPPLPPLPLPAQPSAAPAPAAAALRTAPSVANAAARPRDAAPLQLSLPEPGGVWELSLNEPDGLQLWLRAERVAAPAAAGGAPAAWSLAISALGADAAALQRHAPRLADRLAARALAPAHLRITAERDTRGD